MSTMHTPSNLDNKLYIMQYNQIKGARTGTLDKSEWNK